MGQKIQLSESQLRNLIKESVKKAIMNEISSDTIRSAMNKFSDKYMDQDTGYWTDKYGKDQWGNPLHPKDKKPFANHMRDLRVGLDKAEKDEQFDDPITKEAFSIWKENENDVDWEITDDFGNEGCEVSGYLEVDGWEFSAGGYAERAGGLNVEEIESVEFKSPDGQEGSFRP